MCYQEASEEKTDWIEIRGTFNEVNQNSIFLTPQAPHSSLWVLQRWKVHLFGPVIHAWWITDGSQEKKKNCWASSFTLHQTDMLWTKVYAHWEHYTQRYQTIEHFHERSTFILM